MAEQVTAEEALKKLDIQLKCSLCLNVFKRPKMLPCFHVFCKSPCLTKLVASDGLSLTCPICQHIAPLLKKGVAGVQSDVHIDHLLEIRDVLYKIKDDDDIYCGTCEYVKATGYCNDCREFLCDDCQTAHKKVKLSKTHSLVSLDKLKNKMTSMVLPKKAIPNCPKHSENALKMYCNTCSILICTDCTVRFHKDHNYDLIVDVIAQHKEELATSLKPLKEKLARVQEALKDFDKRATKISNQETATKANICREIDEHIVLLDQRKAELKGELELITQSKQKSLAMQKDPIEMTQKKLSSYLEHVEEALKTGTDGELLEMKASALQRIEQVSTEFDSKALPPKVVADMELVPSNKQPLQQACQSFLEVCNGGSFSAKNSNTLRTDFNNAKIGETKTVYFEPLAENFKPFEGSVDLNVEFVHIKSGNVLKCDVKKEENGQYMISCCPAFRGKHELRLTVNNIPVRDSPFPLTVTGLEKPIRVIRGLRKPRGVAVNSKKQFVVVDCNGTCLSVLTAEGEKIQSFGELRSVYGVTVDLEDNIYVIEENRCCVHKFSMDGVLLATIGKKGGGILEFNSPVDICYNRGDNNLYVPDQDNHRIQIISTDLTFVGYFGTRGSENGQFQKPLCVAFDSAYNLYVTDYNNCRIQVFATGGQFLRFFPYNDMWSKLHCSFPQAIAVDSSDTVYITNSTTMNSVSAFTSQGVHISTIFVSGPVRTLLDGYNLSMFGKHFGLYVDQNDSVVKVNHSAGQLQIY